MRRWISRLVDFTRWLFCSSCRETHDALGLAFCWRHNDDPFEGGLRWGWQ